MTAHSRLFAPGAAGLLLLLPLAAGADDVLLRNGGRISGVIVSRTPQSIVVETSPGRVTLPLSFVDRIVPGASPLQTWRERSAGLADRDAKGWAALGRWADANGLSTQARQAWDRVLAVDPRNAEANAALGRVMVDGRWVSEDEAYRARGYVQYDARWMSTAERDSLVRERAEEETARAARYEAAARLREAEARAREAEARARMAEYAGAPGQNESMPYGYFFGGGYGSPYGVFPVEGPFVGTQQFFSPGVPSVLAGRGLGDIFQNLPPTFAHHGAFNMVPGRSIGQYSRVTPTRGSIVGPPLH